VENFPHIEMLKAKQEDNMSESIQITGTVIKVEETKEYGSNGFTKRLMVIEVPDGQYSNKIPVEAVKDKCAMFDGVNEGDAVTANCNLRSNEWNDRYFLSAQCWKISVDGKAQPADDRPPLPMDDAPDDVVDDDVPF